MSCNCGKKLELENNQIGLENNQIGLENLFDKENGIVDAKALRQYDLEDMIYIYQQGYRLLDFHDPENIKELIELSQNPEYNELNVKSLACPSQSSCPTTTVRVGQTATISICPSGGIAPYTLYVVKNGTNIITQPGLQEGVPYPITDRISPSDGNRITFVSTISDSCPGSPQTCNQTCILNVTAACTPPTCTMAISVT